MKKANVIRKVPVFDPETNQDFIFKLKGDQILGIENISADKQENKTRE